MNIARHGYGKLLVTVGLVATVAVLGIPPVLARQTSPQPTVIPSGTWTVHARVAGYSGPSGQMVGPLARPWSEGHVGSSQVRIVQECAGACQLLISPLSFSMVDPSSDLALPLGGVGPMRLGAREYQTGQIELGYEACSGDNDSASTPTPQLTLKVSSTEPYGPPVAVQLSGFESYALGQVCDANSDTLGWRVIHLSLTAQLQKNSAQTTLAQEETRVAALIGSLQAFHLRLGSLCRTITLASAHQSAGPSGAAKTVSEVGALDDNRKACDGVTAVVLDLADDLSDTLLVLNTSATATDPFSKEQMLEGDAEAHAVLQKWADDVASSPILFGTSEQAQALTTLSLRLEGQLTQAASALDQLLRPEAHP